MKDSTLGIVNIVLSLLLMAGSAACGLKPSGALDIGLLAERIRAVLDADGPARDRLAKVLELAAQVIIEQVDLQAFLQTDEFDRLINDPAITQVGLGNAPDYVTVRLEIENVYYNLGQSDQVTMKGTATRHEVALVDTSYYGEITDIVPDVSKGEEDIVITGRAVERSTEDPMPEVPLDLTITVSGFERSSEVYTDTTYPTTVYAIYRMTSGQPIHLEKPPALTARKM